LITFNGSQWKVKNSNIYICRNLQSSSPVIYQEKHTVLITFSYFAYPSSFHRVHFLFYSQRFVRELEFSRDKIARVLIIGAHREIRAERCVVKGGMEVRPMSYMRIQIIKKEKEKGTKKKRKGGNWWAEHLSMLHPLPRPRRGEKKEKCNPMNEILHSNELHENSLLEILCFIPIIHNYDHGTRHHHSGYVRLKWLFFIRATIVSLEQHCRQFSSTAAYSKDMLNLT